MHIGICLNCGIQKEYKYKSHVKTFCSHKCSNTYKWVYIRKKAEEETRVCSQCNKEYTKQKSFFRVHPDTKFCSFNCYIESVKSNLCECLFCNKIYAKKRKSQKFCSVDCKNNSRKNGFDNKKYMKEYLKKYNEKNRDKLNEMARIRNKTEKGRQAKALNRISRRGAGKITNDDYKIIILNSSGKCYWCKCTVEKHNMHLDHYIPVAKGGITSLENMVVSCRKCNQAKSAKDPMVFANSLGRLF